MAGFDLVGGLEEDGDGAEFLASVPGSIAFGGFALEHEDDAGGERAFQDGIHPGGGDGVGQVGDNFEVCGGAGGGKGGDGLVHGVAFEQVEASGVLLLKGFAEMLVEDAILFDGPDFGTGGEQGGGEGAQTGAHLDDGIRGCDTGEIERLAHDVAVDQEVLPQEAFGAVSKAGEQVAGFGEGEWHGRGGGRRLVSRGSR